MLVAIYFVLSNYFAINLAGIRITLDVLPILVAAALFGPVDAFIVGFIGNFLFQLVGPYGISATTFLWALPDGIRGLLLGVLLKSKWKAMSKPRLIAILVTVAVVFTTVTTGVMYLDCLVYEYSFAAYAPYILIRYVMGIVVAVLSAFLVPPLWRALDKNLQS